MAEIRFKCPGCDAVNVGDAAVQGSTVECSGCGSPLQVPTAPVKPLMAELLDEPDQVPGPAPTKPAEGDLFVLHPVRRGHVGMLSLMVLFALGAIVLLVLCLQKGYSPLWALAPLLVAVYAVGRVFYLTRSLTYRLTSQRLFIQTGLVGRSQEEIELFRITDVSMEQRPMERILGIGTIIVNSTDETMPVARLENIPDPVKHKDILRDAYRQARTREGMRAGEFIGSM